MAPTHLRPVAEPAPRAVLPGDPGRALALAQVLLGPDRLMFNHHRGLWGYRGTALDGEPLIIQATGVGGPSAAIVLEELAAIGVRSAVRVGSCRALGDAPAAGTLVAARGCLGADGVSRAIGGPALRELDTGMAQSLGAAADSIGLVASNDLFHAPDPTEVTAWRRARATVVDLQTAALAAVADRAGVRFGAILVVAGRLEPGSPAPEDEDWLERAAERAGHAATDALRAAVAGGCG